MKKRALISVSDKNGVVDAAKRLAAMGYEIISTGGTQKCLEDAGLKTLNISDVTGFPECLDGRVKTLHPAVHAGLLAKRDNAEHMRRLKELKIQTIDVVIVNLYPFKQTVMSGKGFDEVVENIDIGGPTMLRSAAKNSGDVVVLTDPADYEKALSELEAGEVSRETRLYLMYKVYAHTAAYDSMISAYLAKKLDIDFPDSLTLAFEKKEQLRYGENPFQQAALYTDMFPVSNSIVNARQENGKQLSYNNLNDSNGAIENRYTYNRGCRQALQSLRRCERGDDCGSVQKGLRLRPRGLFSAESSPPTAKSIGNCGGNFQNLRRNSHSAFLFRSRARSFGKKA